MAEDSIRCGGLPTRTTHASTLDSTGTRLHRDPGRCLSGGIRSDGGGVERTYPPVARPDLNGSDCTLHHVAFFRWGGKDDDDDGNDVAAVSNICTTWILLYIYRMIITRLDLETD